jgi:hypothetical protein
VKTYKVRAQRWARGWELHIDGVGVTQSHSLADAPSMARSYIAMTHNAAADSFNVDVVPEVGDGLDQAATEAREAVRAAEEAQRGAAARSRNVARQLKEKGLTGRDIAALLQLSPQRVSQLLRPTAKSPTARAAATADAAATTRKKRLRTDNAA